MKKNSKIHVAWNNLSKAVISNNSGKYKDSMPDYSLEELNLIAEQEIVDFASKENLNKKYERTEGVRLGMESKKPFYRRTKI